MSQVATRYAPRIEQEPGTSAGGPMHTLLHRQYVVPPPFAEGRATVAREADFADWDFSLAMFWSTTSGRAGATEPAPDEQGSAAAILELRRLTGLTWDRLARLFGVARRSVHFWASGKPLNAENEEQLYRTLSVIRTIDRGSAGENRALLLREQGGRRPLDLLAARQYDEVANLLGAGRGCKRRVLPPLSPEARAARAPRPPQELTDALGRNETGEWRGSLAPPTPTKSQKARGWPRGYPLLRAPCRRQT